MGINTSKILGFVHVYTTEHGMQIMQELINVLIDSHLRDNTKHTDFVYTHPSDDPQRYEGRTLEELWKACCSSPWDGLVWYIHTKGASVGPERQDSYRAWRKEMLDTVVLGWRDCVKQFDDDPTLDCYGAHLPIDDRFFYPGNYWWATAKHIRRLPSPRKWAESEFQRGEESRLAAGLEPRDPSDVRYRYEDWLTMSIPRDQINAKAAAPWNPDGEDVSNWAFKKGN